MKPHVGYVLVATLLFHQPHIWTFLGVGTMLKMIKVTDSRLELKPISNVLHLLSLPSQ